MCVCIYIYCFVFFFPSVSSYCFYFCFCLHIVLKYRFEQVMIRRWILLFLSFPVVLVNTDTRYVAVREEVTASRNIGKCFKWLHLKRACHLISGSSCIETIGESQATQPAVSVQTQSHAPPSSLSLKTSARRKGNPSNIPLQRCTVCGRFHVRAVGTRVEKQTVVAAFFFIPVYKNKSNAKGWLGWPRAQYVVVLAVGNRGMSWEWPSHGSPLSGPDR